MGCCESQRESNIAEVFILNISSSLKISSMSLNEIKDILTNLSIMRDSFSKKAIINRISDLRDSNHYEKCIFELILNHVQETFHLNELLFYLFAFLNHRTSGKKPILELFNLFKAINNKSEMSFGSLEKILTDYLCFYTVKLNFCIETNVLKEESENLKNELKLLNQKYYNYNNIRHIVSLIIGDNNEKDNVSLPILEKILNDFEIFDIRGLRDVFTSYFGDVQ